MEDIKLSKKKKRELLIGNYIRAITLNPNAVCVCDGIQYTYDGKNLIIVDMSEEVLESGDLVIDSAYDILLISNNLSKFIKKLDLNNIKRIEGSFGHSNLEWISGKYVTSLPEGCFFYCKNLQTVYFPNVKRVGGGAFHKCESLKHLEIPNLSYMGRDSITYTNLMELTLGDCNFKESSEISNNNNLKKIVFKSVKNLCSDSFWTPSVEYLDLGYFYDSASNYIFNPSESFIVKSSLSHASEITSIVKALIKKGLLTGRIPSKQGRYILPSNELYGLFFDFKSLKELHFKLPQAYKDLNLENYYIKKFEKVFWDNYKNCKVILDN